MTDGLQCRRGDKWRTGLGVTVVLIADPVLYDNRQAPALRQGSWPPLALGHFIYTVQTYLPHCSHLPSPNRLLHDDMKESGLLPVLGRLMRDFNPKTQPRSHAADVLLVRGRGAGGRVWWTTDELTAQAGDICLYLVQILVNAKVGGVL